MLREQFKIFLNRVINGAKFRTGDLLDDITDRVVKLEATVATNTVLCQVLDQQSNALAGVYPVDWVITDADGVLIGTAPNGGVAVTNNFGQGLVEPVANKYGQALTNSDGQLKLTLTESGTADFYVHFFCGAAHIASAVVEFAA